MKYPVTVFAFAMAVLAGSAHAASHAGGAPASANPQQTRMAQCSDQFKASRKPAAQRQAFMKECLKNDPDPRTAQNNRMKRCSADFKASGKPSSERQAYMTECLRK